MVARIARLRCRDTCLVQLCQALDIMLFLYVVYITSRSCAQHQWHGTIKETREIENADLSRKARHCAATPSSRLPH